VLEGIEPQQRAQAVIRLVGCGPNVADELTALGISPDNIAEATAELHARGVRSDLAQFLDRPFEPKGNRTRFSDGTVGVFYSANERPTAVAEVAHHWLATLVGADPNRRVFFHHVICDFEGRVLNLMPLAANEEFANLTNPDAAVAYPACQAIAIEARLIPVDGLLTPSARNLGGTCLPIWERTTLQNVQIVATIALHRDAQGAVIVEPG
jgi:RES domain-containing protein